MNKVYIFGHKNPDTDTVCGAISLAYLKNKLGVTAEARILGPINAETEYALKKFKINIPKYLNDVKVQIKDINYNHNFMINENASILNAFNYMINSSITGIPLVDSNRRFKGYVSLREIASDMIYKENLMIDTNFENLVSTIDGKQCLKFHDQIKGYALSATSNEDNVLSDSIVIIGDREELIVEAINKKANLIILVNNTKMNAEIKKLATNYQIDMIVTSKSSFEVSRLLGLANPIKSIKRGEEIVTFNENDYLSDFKEITSKLTHINYPIVDNSNCCLGMLRTTDINDIVKKQVILVDHNMTSQSVEGLNEAEILEIIDHHNLGDIITNNPINFRSMIVGSVNTIIYQLYKENKIKIPADIAGIMLSGIIGDTLILKSPTTTENDILVANELAKIANINIEKYGLDLLSSGVSIKNKTTKEIINSDFKTYTVNNQKFGIGQVMTTNINIFNDRLMEIIEELDQMAEANDFVTCTLFITNFLNNNSYLFYSTKSKDLLSRAFDVSEIKQGYIFEGLLSRKKQIVPEIMAELED